MPLTLTGIGYTYASGTGFAVSAVRDVSFEVAVGELVLVLGATGSGKSTLLRLAAGLLEPQPGHATIDGAPLDRRTARGSVGLVFQDAEAQLFADTVVDDVAFGPRNLGHSAEDAQALAREALASVGLDPQLFGERSPFSLSGGEARRAAIAGVLAMQPRYLLADEPTAGLDAPGRSALRRLLLDARSRAGVVVVSHTAEEFLGAADRVLVLSDGESRVVRVRCGVGGRPRRAGARRACRAGAARCPGARCCARSRRRRLHARRAGCGRVPGGREGAGLMPVPVPFGQFVPGDSPVHRLDARVKIGVTLAFTIALFAFDSWAGLGVAAVAVAVAVSVSGVPWRLAARGLRAISWLLLFTLVANALRLDSASALASIGPVDVDGPGLARGAFFAARILLLVLGTSLVTLTTSPVALTDGLSSIMRPLGYLRFPVDDVAMMLSIALRFVPTTAEEAERIVVAQTARGARFDEGGPIARARAWLPVLVPLFVRLFRRADDLAIAMESRCYTGQKRTRLRELVMRTTDWVVLATAVTSCIAAAILL